MENGIDLPEPSVTEIFSTFANLLIYASIASNTGFSSLSALISISISKEVDFFYEIKKLYINSKKLLKYINIML